jgi:hypothetical protein
MCGPLKLAVVPNRAKKLIRVAGEVGSCVAGTASIYYDGIYELRDDTLFLVREIVAGLH